MRAFSFIVAALLFAFPVRVQAERPAETTLQGDLAREIAKLDDHRFLTLNVENDLFGGGTDHYYTSGVRLTYFDIGAETPEFFGNISRIFPTFTINDTTSISYSAGQNLFTPSDIRQAVQDPRDRPWGGFLYGSAGLTTITKNHVDQAEVTLGVVGPAALGEQTQRFIHKNISDSPEPQGWDNQLKNEPGIILAWQRLWPGLHSAQGFGLYAGTEPYVGLTVGNVYTYANAGLSLRLSPQAGRWQDDPPRVRPSMPGTGAFIVPDKTFSWYLFGGVETRAVARNIFLDGNTFTDSYSVDKLPLVADASAGLALTYGKARLSYSLIYRTDEFTTQEGNNIFAAVTLGYRY
jgi:lipid A 3-O-deacylase